MIGMFGPFLPEPWFVFTSTKSTQVEGADTVM
jgi:hypothetical protein